ncbi:MAG TPA: DUF2272 domain-containing protein [Ensifer sp.]|nr:DUF2272 domain-containing protein [Ensifer sp.]
MAKTLQDLLDAANKEWNHWGNSTWNLTTGKKKIGHTDDEDKFADYIIANYCSIVKDKPSANDISNDEYYWSAVGMSAFFHGAKFTKNEFPFANAHSKWIRRFVKAKKENQPALYWGYRLKDEAAKPDVGDLIGYTYSKVSFDEAQSFYDKTGNYQSHTDLVVAKNGNSIDVIGANVLDSVTKKTLDLTADGHIADRSHKWFVVLKRKGF